MLTVATNSILGESNAKEMETKSNRSGLSPVNRPRHDVSIGKFAISSMLVTFVGSKGHGHEAWSAKQQWALAFLEGIFSKFIVEILFGTIKSVKARDLQWTHISYKINHKEHIISRCLKNHFLLSNMTS